ncbi:MAG TPA: glycoside hydrolase family 172 protein [Pyrinomonadaceae bacterium]|nr:glycoside hydrolase family 172 protein [Pyrinomonadaceae bacterium]
MKRTLLACLMLAAAAAVFPTRGQQPADSARMPRPGVEELYRLDLLPVFRRSVEVGSVSSYDRTGGNDDGFSGKYSFVRREPGGLVIADLKGPGAIYRIWTPTPTDDIVEFYFDGEENPRIRVRFSDLFSGREFPFLSPVVGIGAGGFYSYLPLPYKESCKVLLKAERLMFYQINYATYPAGSQVESYSAQAAGEFAQHLERARKLFASPGSDLSAYTTPGGERSLQTHQFSQTLQPGKSVTIFESSKPGRVAGLRLGPARAFARKERDVLIKFYWDGESTPAVSCPVGDFFGYSWGQPAVKSLLLGTSGDENYIYLPMPFDRSARIELVSEAGGGEPLEVRGEVKFSGVGRREDEGKLYAVWRRENPTTEGKPFTFVDATGKGHAVGFILQAQGLEPGATPEFFEGDDETTIDGELAIHGTGSEDFFNGGWYDVPGRWEDRVSLPLSGSLDFKRHLGRTGGYRFLLADAYAFRKNILSTIEHGPEGNKVRADYTAVTFLYSDTNPAARNPLPKLAERGVADPDRVVFTPGWNTPIHAFSWSNAVLLKTDDKIGDEQLRHLSLRAEGREVFGDHYISFICEMPAAGRYRVSIEAIKGPSQGVVQIFRNEVGQGERADLYAPARVRSGVLPLAELEMKEGDNRVMFKLVGKNEKSSGLGFDLYRIIFEKVQ